MSAIYKGEVPIEGMVGIMREIISPARGPNTYQIMHVATLDFQYQHQQLQHEIPDRKNQFLQ